MNNPVPGFVRPRVVGCDGNLRLLEDIVEARLKRHARGCLLILGTAGSGKTMALQYLSGLAETRPDWKRRLRFIDTSGNVSFSSASHQSRVELVIATAVTGAHRKFDNFTLARWGRDDIIEYLLLNHPENCQSVMARISDIRFCEGTPRLLTMILDALAEDKSLANARTVIFQFLDSLKLNRGDRSNLTHLAWAKIARLKDEVDALSSRVEKLLPPSALQLLSLDAVQGLLACEHYAEQLCAEHSYMILQHRLPDDLLPEIAVRLRNESNVLAQLRNLLRRSSDELFHAAAATILVAIDPTWRPSQIVNGANLTEATLNGIHWTGIDLSNANFSNASLNEADLSGANLYLAKFHSTSICRASLQQSVLTTAQFHYCDATWADFRNASLAHSVFEECDLDHASFDGAELTESFLTNSSFENASFRNAMLQGAMFSGSRLNDCDFNGADLSESLLESLDLRTCQFDRAVLEGVVLRKCILEDTFLPNAKLARANLVGAHLTGSQLQYADLKNADLTGACLGEIDWENADLRNANLSFATFHMGSSREGLLSSPFASEGTRTGFYTDEYTEQNFKAPEEIRKANLKGADLRGAVLAGVDFYLVDLRNALLDPHQLAFVQSSGAILNDWAVD